ncbi:MAG: hypothetical protein HLUCCA12_01675 [Rhodobacteraceae bacterium HLUCCA12]|nr:MAG: hypothetical protein HLUCCA12_01675 [Rhodobacteraceae bacterium HLUCCA12]
MKAPDLAAVRRLQQIAAMKRDHELARLATIAQGRDRLRTALATLDRNAASLDAATAPGLLQAQIAHQRWVEGRRNLLHQRLALVQADFLDTLPAARRAFGKADVLARIIEQETTRHRHRGQRP